MEGLNGLFQAARVRASGYRNTATIITMIHQIATALENLFDSFETSKNPISPTRR
jgi:hypothetical protein